MDNNIIDITKINLNETPKFSTKVSYDALLKKLFDEERIKYEDELNEKDELIEVALHSAKEFLEYIEELGIMPKHIISEIAYAYHMTMEEFDDTFKNGPGIPLFSFLSDDDDFIYTIFCLFQKEESDGESFVLLLQKTNSNTGATFILGERNEWIPTELLKDENEEFLSEDEIISKSLYQDATPAQLKILRDDPIEASFLECVYIKNGCEPILDKQYNEIKARNKKLLELSNEIGEDCGFSIDNEQILLISYNTPGFGISEKNGMWKIYQFLEEEDIEYLLAETSNYTLDTPITYKKYVGSTKNTEDIKKLFTNGTNEEILLFALPLSEQTTIYYDVDTEMQDVKTIQKKALEHKPELSKTEKDNLYAFTRWFSNFK